MFQGTVSDSADKAVHSVIPLPSSTTMVNLALSFVSGAATGAIECLITYPTEYAKTHLQLQQRQAHPHTGCSGAVAVTQRVPYGGMWDCVRRTVRESGVRGLYSGVVPLLVGTVPKQASRWATFDYASAKMKRRAAGSQDLSPEALKDVKLSLWALSACGFFAGTVEALCAVIPTETVKTILIDDRTRLEPRYKHLSFPQALRAIVHDEGGLLGLYRGVSSTIAKQGVNQALRFPLHFMCMQVFCSDYAVLPFGKPVPVGTNEQRRRTNPLWNGAAGFVAGVASVVATQPIDTVKTKMQSVAAGRTTTKSSGHPHRSTLACARQLYRACGIRGMYAGVMARSLRVGIDVALTFTLFPIVKNFFSKASGKE